MKRINVTSFGPIREANIELGDLTVLVGPQASGCLLKGRKLCCCRYATAASPFLSTSDSNLSDAPEGHFLPRSHLLTKLLVTFK